MNEYKSRSTHQKKGLKLSPSFIHMSGNSQKVRQILLSDPQHPFTPFLMAAILRSISPPIPVHRAQAGRLIQAYPNQHTAFPLGHHDWWRDDHVTHGTFVGTSAKKMFPLTQNICSQRR